MTETYFSKFNIINYNNIQVRDISERVAVITRAATAPFDYFPYELGNQLRPDQLAGAYYGDPNLDWMIYLVNGIVDPYYGWYLYDLDFDEYIIQKYGTLTEAFQRVSFWRTNWPSDPQEIPPDHFDNFPGQFKKYFQPKWGPKQRILSYVRRQDDLSVNTNKINQYSVTGNTFSNGDLIVVNNGDDTGSGEIISANSSSMIVKDIFGSNTTAGVIRLRSDASHQTTINSVTNIVTNIPDIEGAFWEPVSNYDVEKEMNENKRFIDVLGNNIVFNVAETVRKALLPQP